MNNILSIILLALFIISCRNEENVSEKELSETYSSFMEDSLVFEEVRSHAYFSGPFFDTLFISTRFNECGEWGGHIELLKIYRNDQDELRLDYIEDRADCEKIGSDRFREVIFEKCQGIKADDEKAIVEYLQHLLVKSLKFQFPFYPVRSYRAYTKDSSFSLHFPSHHREWDEYEKMKRQLVGK